MGTSNLMSNLMSGDMANFNRGQSNIGIPVLNNQGTPSMGGGGISGTPAPYMPAMGSTGGAPPSLPGGTILPPAGLVPSGTSSTNPFTGTSFGSPGNPILGKVIEGNGGMPPQQAYTSGTPGGLYGTPGAPSTGVPPSSGIPTSPTNPGVTGQTPQQAQEQQKQLVDIYGKGTGNLLNTLIGNIGGSDDAYMQAYEQAMAGPNAENLATLNTTLGNSGIGMNSSTAAIANADFESNITSQEGLQEQ